MYLTNISSVNPLSLQRLRVLVVDNNIDSRNLVTLLLQLYQVEVKTVPLSELALKLFVQWQPDVLVSELALPEKDGFALIHQLRTQTGDRGRMVLAIAVTGHATEEIQRQALSSGFDVWFTKPLDLDAFIVAVASASVRQRSLCAIGLTLIDQFVQKRLGQVNYCYT